MKLAFTATLIVVAVATQAAAPLALPAAAGNAFQAPRIFGGSNLRLSSSQATANAGCGDCISVGDFMGIDSNFAREGGPTFPNPQHGWLTGQILDTAPSCQNNGWDCRLALLATNNGGLTWRPDRPPVATAGWVGSAGRQHGVGSVLFANDRDGWVYGVGIWSTQDGGRTWHHDATGPIVQQLEAYHGKVWALESPCSAFDTCRMTLKVATIGSRSWRRVSPALPPLQFWTGRTHLLVGEGQLFVLSSNVQDGGTAGGSGPNGVLLASAMGGRNWQVRSYPCRRTDPALDDDFSADLAVGSGHLWMLCAAMPMSGLQPQPLQQKALYKSGDGGRHWRMVSFTDGYPSDCKNIKAPSSARCDLPAAGTVVPGGLTMTRRQRMWLTLARGALWISADGGLKWRQSLPYPQGGTPGYGLTPVYFADPLHGWAAGEGSWSLFRTVDDGGHWIRITIHKHYRWPSPR